MNKEVKAEWINALNSGKYQKAKGYLKKDCSYCCLGVLCKLYEEKVDNTCYFDKEDHFVIGYEEGWGYSALAPSEVQKWAGFDHEAMADLIKINDNNETFYPVVEYIENL